MLEKVEEKITELRDESIEILSNFLKIPTVAAKGTGTGEALEFLKQIFREAGFEFFISETPGNPVFCAEMNVNAEKTITFYDHYDVQPEEPIELWENPPFKPVIKDGKIFARGVSDNKGEIICRLQAIKAYNEIYEKPPVNIKFIIEGEEEIGSPNLEIFTKHNKEFVQETNGVIWEFGDKDKEGIQQIYLGVKGILYLHLKAKTIGVDVHSGNTQFVNNAAYEMVWALSSLKDKEDNIQVSGFLDNISKPTKEEIELIDNFNLKEEQFKEIYDIEEFRLGLSGKKLKRKYFLEPTINICGLWSGYQGPGSKTVTPMESFAKVDCRLVPGQDPTDLIYKIREYWDSKGFKDVKIVDWDGYPAAKTMPDDPFAKAVIKTVREVYGHKPNIWPLSGGSGPMYLFKDIACVSIGTGHAESRAHAPNENIYVEDWIRGMKTIATLIHNFSKVSSEEEESSG